MSRSVEQLEGASSPARDTPSERALHEAAEWRVRLAEEPVPETERCAFEHWLQADADHALAWREMETTWDALGGARRPGARAALDRSYREERREARRLLGGGAGILLVLLAVLPATWLGLGLESPGHLLADHHTAIGERRIIELSDGSRLVLDTASAVDIQFDVERRRIRLHDGRFFIDVAPDPDRPLEVVTAEARATALGTRFSVRLLQVAGAEATRLSVYESRVELCPAAGGDECRRLRGGQRADAASSRVGPVTAFPAVTEPDWVRGHLEIDDRPVTEVLAELARYHRGLLRYDEAALAGLEVSGVLPLDDTGRALNALAATVPLRIERYTPWVITVTRASR